MIKNKLNKLTEITDYKPFLIELDSIVGSDWAEDTLFTHRPIEFDLISKWTIVYNLVYNNYTQSFRDWLVSGSPVDGKFKACIGVEPDARFMVGAEVYSSSSSRMLWKTF